MIFLHELFHLDLAADSEGGKPNPKIYDIVIRYNDPEGNIQGPEKAYTARLSKLLARFLPSGRGKDPKSTGYWVQRNVDNFSRYAMAKYLEGKIGGYPFLPLIYDKLLYPEQPKPRQGKSMIGFEGDESSQAKLDVDTSDMDGELLAQAEEIDPTREPHEEFEVGQPIGLDEYPESYKTAYAKWMEMLQGSNDGTCKARVEEIRTCEDEASNLYARVQITNADGETIYTTPGSAHTPGKPIGVDGPLEFSEEGMDSTFTVERGDSYDYLQFSYGSTSWKSSDTSGEASCELDGDDWDGEGPECDEGAFVSHFPTHVQCKTWLTNFLTRLAHSIASIHAVHNGD